MPGYLKRPVVSSPVESSCSHNSYCYNYQRSGKMSRSANIIFRAAAMTLRTVLLSLQSLLSSAEPDDPQDAVVAKQVSKQVMYLPKI